MGGLNRIPLLCVQKVILHPLSCPPHYFQVLVALACDLGLDMLQCCSEAHKWAWFRRYCMAARVAAAIVRRSLLPTGFCEEVMKKAQDISADGEELSRDHENQEIFHREHDEQLLMWLNRYSHFTEGRVGC